MLVYYSRYILRMVSGAVLSLSIVTGGVITAVAGDLTYRPINPSFGGDSFNSSHLLTTADIQNQFEAPPPEINNDPFANFERTITSSLLSRISLQIADQILGEDPQDSGNFVVGDVLLEFERVGETVVIELQNSTTGELTSIELPAPQF